MIQNKTSFTFFTPTMQKTGSEIALTNYLSTVKNDFSFQLVSFSSGGSLWSKYKNLFSENHLYIAQEKKGLLQKIIHRFEKAFLIPSKLKKYRNSIWYINTIVLPEVLEYAEKWNVRVIVHTHEMEQMYALLNKNQLNRLLNYPELILASSNISASILVKLGRTKEIKICYPAIDTSHFKRNEVNYNLLRKKLGYTATNKLWVMCGTLDSNKNPNLFLEVAQRAIKQMPDLRFMWIGTTNNLEFAAEFEKNIDRLDLRNCVFWAKNVEENFYDYYNCADGLLLSSLKESFSLVTLEALLLGLPVVANDCGGVREILKTDIGSIEDSSEKLTSALLQCSQSAFNPDINFMKKRALEFDLAICSIKWKKILLNFSKL
jgi:glycosyltransferase involved in cell wall biosynthesis